MYAKKKNTGSIIKQKIKILWISNEEIAIKIFLITKKCLNIGIFFLKICMLTRRYYVLKS